MGKQTVSSIAKLIWIWVSMACVSLGAIMVIYTLFFGRNKVTLNESIYQNHRFVGQPGAVQLATGEGYGLTTYGPDGLIVSKVLDPQAFRILFVGDSFVKAKQVFDDEKFTEIIERRWNAEQDGQRIQALNIGLGGQNAATYISFGKNMDRHFQPNLIFLMVSADDFRKVLRNPKILEKIAQQVDQPFVEPERSSTVQTIANQLGIRSFLGQIQAQTFAFIAPKNEISVAEADEGASQRNQIDRDEAISILVEALYDIWGNRLVIVYRTPVPELGINQPSQVTDPILDHIKTQNIPVVELYPRFLEAFNDHQPPLGFHNSVLGQGHLNIYGHQIVADEIIRYLETRDDLF